MTTVTYSIPNISCNHCVHTIESEVTEVEGVRSVTADLATKKATISFDAPATEAGREIRNRNGDRWDAVRKRNDPPR